MDHLITNKERKEIVRELDWFNQEYNHINKRPRDLLIEAKTQFREGRFEAAITILQIYVKMPKGMEDNICAAFHLMGHCYLRLGEADKGQQFFLAAIGAGYEADWQTIVEVECDLASRGR